MGCSTRATAAAVWFHPVPVGNFRSIELLINMGTASSGNVQKMADDTTCAECCVWACCVNACCPTCCGNEYDGQLTMTSSVNDRYVELNFEGAAWQDRKVLRLHISEGMELPAVQEWVSHLLAGCPKLRDPAQLGVPAQ